MKNIRVIAASAVAALLGLITVFSTVLSAGSAHAATKPTTASPCAYWTANKGISAVAVTSGVNCTNKPWTIGLPPYDGATFADYNAFLSQVGEFVHGPGAVPNLAGFTKVGSANNAYTRHQVVTVYQGPGLNDGSSAGFNYLIHGEYPWGRGPSTGPVSPATVR